MRQVLSSIFLCYLLFLILNFGLKASFDSTRPWINPVVDPDEIKAAVWMKDYLPEDSIVNGGIFGGEMFMAIGNVRNSVGGDWFLINDSAEWMGDCEKIYVSKSVEEILPLLKKRRINYVFIPPPRNHGFKPPHNRQIHCGYGWKDIERDKFKNTKYFEKVFERNETIIYRVKEVSPESWPFQNT